eukprot:785730-Amorphochlora_amoeboformis.AAC.1
MTLRGEIAFGDAHVHTSCTYPPRGKRDGGGRNICPQGSAVPRGLIEASASGVPPMNPEPTPTPAPNLVGASLNASKMMAEQRLQLLLVLLNFSGPPFVTLRISTISSTDGPHSLLTRNSSISIIISRPPFPHAPFTSTAASAAASCCTGRTGRSPGVGVIGIRIRVKV